MAEAPLASDDDLRQAGAYEDFSSGTLKTGTQLGRYELVLPVAVGGMARVWAARMYGHRGFTKLVAIKTILPHLARDPEFERMFLDEARIASGVHHPNVCEIYELGEERGVLYLAMEWVGGDSLAHVLKRKAGAGAPAKSEPLDPRIAGRIIADACAGLHAAHNLVDDEGNALSVVHRDVAPHNILLSADGNVKVADFGVAKALGLGHDATARGQLKGRIAYMAPEQVSGGAIDRRSDLFSLGIVLYEATTGKQPFRGEGDHQVMHELLKGQLTPPSRVVKGYPYELERIVMRAMAPQAMHRYTTMDQMRVALEEWLAKSGPVVTQSHVAAVVRERVGAEIDKRRERIRLASSERESGDTAATSPDASVSGSGIVTTGSIPAPRGSVPPGRVSSPGLQASTSATLPATPAARVSSAPGQLSSPPARVSSPPGQLSSPAAHLSTPPRTSATPPPPPPAATSIPPPQATHDAAPAREHASPLHYALASAVGVAVAGIIAVAAFFALRPADAPQAARAIEAPVAAAQATAEGEAKPTPSETKPPEAPATAKADAPPIVFKVVPATASLVVDGAPLAVGARAIPRPAKGESHRIVVRADGFADEALTIDEAAPASVDVWLTPKRKDAKGEAHPARSADDHPPAPAPPKRTADVLPANPY